MFENIPQELRLLRQWICWRYVDMGGPKLTKVPINPHTGYNASVKNSLTWGSFTEAFNAYNSNAGSVSGIGFVFSNSDPYCGFDLDGLDRELAANEITQEQYDDALNIQTRIYNHICSYSEYSPSGKGLHIICKGFVPQGKKTTAFEVYSQDRFFTMTGNVYRDIPITEQQDNIRVLWGELIATEAPADIVVESKKQKESDEDVVARARAAANGAKFASLWFASNEFVDGSDRSHSAVDQAFVNILAFYTRNVEQIERIWLNAPIGQRAKTQKRKEYRDWTIRKAFDQVLPEIDLTGFRDMAKALSAKLKPVSSHPLASQLPEAFFDHGALTTPFFEDDDSSNNPSSSNGRTADFESVNAGSSPAEGTNPIGEGNKEEAKELRPALDPIMPLGEPPALDRGKEQNPAFIYESQISKPKSSPYSVPTGLLGEIAQFVYEASPRPVPEISLAAAIGFMAGLCGRAYNVSNTGLNLYTILLAKTGIGKEAMAIGIEKIVQAIKARVPTADEFLGPSDIASGMALTKYMSNGPKSFVSIVGEFGYRLEQITSVRANGGDRALVAVMLDLFNKSGENQIARPRIYSDKDKNTLSVIAPAFSLLGESTPSRFYGALNDTMISSGLLPRFLILESHSDREDLSQHYTQAVPSRYLLGKLESLVEYVQHMNAKNMAIKIGLTLQAQKISDSYDRQQTRMINAEKVDVMAEIRNRAHLKALKLAALYAIGNNYSTPIVTPVELNWAIEIVNADVDNLIGRFERGEFGKETEESHQIDYLMRLIREYHIKNYSELKKPKPNREQHFDRVIPYTYFSSRVLTINSFRGDRLGATNALRRCIQMLIERDTIREVPPSQMKEKYNTSARGFILSDMSVLTYGEGLVD